MPATTPGRRTIQATDSPTGAPDTPVPRRFEPGHCSHPTSFSPPPLSPTLPPTLPPTDLIQTFPTPGSLFENTLAVVPSTPVPSGSPFPPLDLPLPHTVFTIPPQLARGVAHPEAKRDSYAADTQKYINTALHYQQARLLLIRAFPSTQDLELFNRISWTDAQQLAKTWYSWLDVIGTYVRCSPGASGY